MSKKSLGITQVSRLFPQVLHTEKKQVENKNELLQLSKKWRNLSIV